jgi:hypothetical protein
VWIFTGAGKTHCNRAARLERSELRNMKGIAMAGVSFPAELPSGLAKNI